MNLLDRIESFVIHIVGVFSESVWICLFFMCTFCISTVLCIVGLTSGLFEMHRSRTNIKKTRRKYTLSQRFRLMPAWYECLHAKGFCRFLIIVYHTRLVLMLLFLILTILVQIFPILMVIIAPFTAVVFFVVDIPILLFHALMDRYPLKKLKHEYRFRKYHNTDDHYSLF